MQLEILRLPTTSDIPAKRIAQSAQVRTRSANWTDALDVILLSVLKEHHMLGNCVGGHVKKEAWKDIIPTFNQQSGVSLGKDHLKNRLKVLKTTFSLYSTLASRSGWGWDYVHNIPKPESSSDWETVTAANPKYAKCKDRPFQAYKDLEVIFGNIVVGNHDIAIMLDDNGSGDNTSLPSPGDLDAAHAPALNLNKGVPSSSIIGPIRAADLNSLDLPSTVPTQPRPINSSPNPMNPRTPLNECPIDVRATHSRKRPRCGPPAPCACKVTSSDTKVLSELVEIGKQCLQIARELLNRDLAAKPNAYSMEECIEKLNGLQNLSDEAMLAALEAFKDKDNRIIFIGLKGPLLSAWIDKQVAMQSQAPVVVEK